MLTIADDWLLILRKLGDEAKAFVEEASVIFASVRLTPLFLIHADTRPGWGVDAIGKALVEDVFRIHVKRQGDRRVYGVLHPAEKARTVKGKVVYPSYGSLPSGQPSWPVLKDTSGVYPGNIPTVPPVKTAIPARYTGRSMPAIEQPPPARIRVRLSAEKVQIVDLSSYDWRQARKVYRQTGTVKAVVDALGIRGGKQVRICTAKALVGLKPRSR